MDHEAPIASAINYAYVKIKNRGHKMATKVVVRGFSSKRSIKLAYPRDWQPMKTAKLAAPNVPPDSSAEIVVGPFAWVPAPAGRNALLMAVSARGDSSNIDNLIRRVSMPNARLVPHDNNIGQRNVTVGKNPHQRHVRR